MLKPDIVILYVENLSRSAAFYADLLGVEPVQASPAFVLFTFPNGASFGLWVRNTVEPAAPGAGQGARAGQDGELAFVVEEVDALHTAWTDKDITILQPPTRMGFGYGFTALDPDGHRLRVFRPAPK
ncbi:VOC family protein [Acetobacter farinalis]|uniref:VOC family protein n=1 Tax=Acetobacter farinalis TaxID=1260984 RepID=A0ABT3Q615_9PROT|nr:VOC family protein [Acetobacter farinalis]MCX2560712.1 VOC family protein [Acetobacter farinalis]NHO29148.1 drug:proton antiporter [Acetobacter farinalis]